MTKRTPDFNYFIKVLKREPTDRSVMFEFILGEEKEKLLVGKEYDVTTDLNRNITRIKAFTNAGYDHCPILINGALFPRKQDDHKNVQTKSLNAGSTIVDRETFNNYQWPSVANCDFSLITKAGKFLEGNMKFTPYSYDGILENAIGIVGYENLCYLLYDDEELFADVFEKIGTITMEYFAKCLEYDEVGAILCNDDWGFNSQTMLPPSTLRKYVFPWYQKIVKLAHNQGKLAFVHSCGYYHDIIDDMINEIKFDGKHSFEDNICPVEQAYEDLKDRIAILGGIDMNFLAHKSSAEVYLRCKEMLKRAKQGGYALGSGNSIPDYIPSENYLAMLKAGTED
jgi:uroporphyrinogen decarboxylase